MALASVHKNTYNRLIHLLGKAWVRCPSIRTLVFEPAMVFFFLVQEDGIFLSADLTNATWTPGILNAPILVSIYLYGVVNPSVLNGVELVHPWSTHSAAVSPRTG